MMIDFFIYLLKEFVVLLNLVLNFVLRESLIVLLVSSLFSFDA